MNNFIIIWLFLQIIFYFIIIFYSAPSPNPFLKGSATRKSKTLSRNRDPGVESDEEFEGDLADEDDMFRYARCFSISPP